MGQDGTKLDQVGSKWDQIWNEFMIKCDKMGPTMDQETKLTRRPHRQRDHNDQETTFTKKPDRPRGHIGQETTRDHIDQETK